MSETLLGQRIDRTFNVIVKKAKQLPYGQVEVIVSTSSLDRHGETINVAGINTKRFMENPVVLWAHDYESLPIGKVERVWKSEGKLLAKIQFMTEILPFADVVYQLILAGAINAVSIGGIVNEYSTDKGTTNYEKIEKLEMVELSVVPVGANPDALVTSKSINIEPIKVQEVYKDFIKSATIQSKLDETIQISRDLLSALETTRVPKESVEDSANTIKRKRYVYSQQRQIVKTIKTRSEQLISDLNAELKRIHNERRKQG